MKFRGPKALTDTNVIRQGEPAICTSCGLVLSAKTAGCA